MTAQELPLPEGFQSLSADEKLAYIERLYALVDDDEIALSGEQLSELDRRLEAHREMPDNAKVRADLLKRWR